MRIALFLLTLLVAILIGAYILMQPTQEITDSQAQCTPPEVIWPLEANASKTAGMTWIKGGSFTLGAGAIYPDESPQKTVDVEGFWIDTYEVSNAQFARFVKESGYITFSERQKSAQEYPEIPAPLRAPGSVVFIMPTDIENNGDLTQWWQFVPGANWRHPRGPDSSIEGKEHYPVVHITYDDALAYAKWLGRDLPTEVQWEYAARGGLQQKKYAWGNQFKPDKTWRANTWQGLFPITNTQDDGFIGASPIGCFPSNGYGLYDMIGNVWEWTSSWYYPSHSDALSTANLPTGYAPGQAGVPVKVIKGGSFLCAENYCKRYRPAARHAQDSTLGAAHLGFRTVINAKKVTNKQPIDG